MISENRRPRSLREIEAEVLEEGREWARRRLEQRLQAEADRCGGVFPPQRAQVGSAEHRAAAWVEGRLHRLRHGQEKAVLQEIAALKAPRGPAGKVV